VGVGNDLRGDDAAGLEVVRRLRDLGGENSGIDVHEHRGDALGLLERLTAARAALLVDAVRAAPGSPVGTISCIDAGREWLRDEWSGAATTHVAGLGAAVELGRRLGTLPPLVVVYGISGAEFLVGQGPSAQVARAIPLVAARVRLHALRLARASN